MKKLVHGVGIYKSGKFKVEDNGKRCREYSMWYDMIKRCYSPNWLNENMTYRDCVVSEKFKDYQYFAEWVTTQIGWNEIGYQLDKDVLSKGNKIYSETACLLVPKQINQFFVKSCKTRGKYPTGVSYDVSKGNFKATCCDGNGNNKYLGRFSNSDYAFQAYKEYKENLAKELARVWSAKVDLGVLDYRVILALDSFVVQNNSTKSIRPV